MSTDSDLQDVSLTLVAAVLLSSTCRLISDGDSYPISPNPPVSFGPRQILLLDYQLVVEVHKAILTQQLTLRQSELDDGRMELQSIQRLGKWHVFTEMVVALICCRVRSGDRKMVCPKGATPRNPSKSRH